MPPMEFPEFRAALAVQNGVEKNILFHTWGGLGDQICAEPTMRYAFDQFKTCSISLASHHPELFSHLPFKKVYDLRECQPHWQKYLVFPTVAPPGTVAWMFFSQMLTHCIDACSLTALRCQLPIIYKQIHLKPTEAEYQRAEAILKRVPKHCIVHAGKHWQSKTFPSEWWDSVISKLIEQGIKPIIIGADTSDNRTTVDIKTDGCLDVRNQLTIMESVALLHLADVLVTNDSSPVHMAASANKCNIGFIATVKHPDHITHWRNGCFGYRMQNLGTGGIWNELEQCPNTAAVSIDAENVGDKLLEWLPPPTTVVEWVSKQLEGLT